MRSVQRFIRSCIDSRETAGLCQSVRGAFPCSYPVGENAGQILMQRLRIVPNNLQTVALGRPLWSERAGDHMAPGLHCRRLGGHR
jgi:hypothetical protein